LGREGEDVEHLINTAVNKTTTKTPYEALNGYLLRFQSGTLLSRTLNESNSPEEVQAEVRENIVHEQTKMKNQ